MKNRLQTLYTGYSKVKTAIVTMAMAVYFVLLILSGASVAEWVILAVAIGLLVVVPGYICTKKVINPPSGFFAPTVILCGSVFAVLLYVISMLLNVRWMPGAVMICMGLVAIWLLWQAAKNKTLDKIKKTVIKPHAWMLMLLFSALVVLYAFYSVVKNAVPTAVGDIILHLDILQYAGDANALKLSFPPTDIRFDGVPLSYHYLTSLFAALFSMASGIDAYPIISFYMQPFILAAMVICIYSLGKVIFKQNVAKSLLFSYSIFIFSCASLWKILPNGLSVFWNSSIIHHITNINSQATATVFLSVFLGYFVLASREKYKVPFMWHLVCVLGFTMLCLAKGPPATILIIAVSMVLIIGLFQKNTTKQGVILGVVLGVIFLVSWMTLFNASQTTDGVEAISFRFSGTLEKGYFVNILAHIKTYGQVAYVIAVPVLWVVQSFLMLPAQFMLYVYAALCDVRRLHKLSPDRLLYHAMAVGGLLAYFLFDHNGMSQMYFFIVASFFINLLVIEEIDNIKLLWQTAKQKTKSAKVVFCKVVAVGLACCAVVGVLTTGFLYVHMIGSGARQLGRNLGVLEKYPYELVVTADDVNAMQWLEENSPVDAVFATNRIHASPKYEGISNLYTAFCQRQSYCDGFQYTYYNAGLSNDDVVQRLLVLEAIFGEDTPMSEVLSLCEENNISYLVFSSQMDGQGMTDEHLVNNLPLVFDSENVRIYEVK